MRQKEGRFSSLGLFGVIFSQGDLHSYPSVSDRVGVVLAEIRDCSPTGMRGPNAASPELSQIALLYWDGGGALIASPALEFPRCLWLPSPLVAS